MSFLSDFVGKITNSVTFLTDGDFTVPKNVNFLFATGQGAGASGGVLANRISGIVKAGPSGRLIVREVIPVTPGQVIPVTIGKGGDSQTLSFTGDSSKAGLPGGSTSLGDLLTIPGGSPDNDGTAFANDPLEGTGASRGGGDNGGTPQPGEDILFIAGHGNDLPVKFSGGAVSTHGGDLHATGGGAGYFGNGGDGLADNTTNNGTPPPANSGSGAGGRITEANAIISSIAGADGRLELQW